MQVGGNAAAVAELNKELDTARQQLQKANEESQRSSTEMERLLQLVQMSQEEQNAKEKTIMELQQSVLYNENYLYFYTFLLRLKLVIIIT